MQNLFMAGGGFNHLEEKIRIDFDRIARSTL
jgi:hypothetical protein